MDGYIFIYKPDLTSKEITELNYRLFGKILTKKNKKYYYAGIFDSIPYFKLSNGCYFIESSNADSLSLEDAIITFKVSNLVISKDLFVTARAEKQKRYSGTFVKNL